MPPTLLRKLISVSLVLFVTGPLAASLVVTPQGVAGYVFLPTAAPPASGTVVKIKASEIAATQTVTASGPVTPPKGTTFVQVIAMGGGGGGGGGGGFDGSGGGGAGYVTTTVFPYTSGAITVSIGSGGSGGAG